MISLGQLTHLPESVAANPFYRLIVKFSRSKTGSFETLFTIEAFLLRYTWIALIVLFALVLPPLEEVDYLSTFVRLSTLLYPCFFIWSLTRLAGVELMQLVLEGHWTSEILATSITDRDLIRGFITPLWLTVRQYFLISVFSLSLYNLETTPLVSLDGRFLNLIDLIRVTLFNYGLFLSTVGWIGFVYMGRLFVEVRLRNGLIKGLASLSLLLGGISLLAAFCALFFLFRDYLMTKWVVAGLALLSLTLFAGAGWFHVCLARNFRDYLMGQVDIDPFIYDETDPHATAWQQVSKN